MKKALKIIGISFLIIIAILLVIPFAFQSQIKEIVKRSINENINAQVEFSDVSLSFLRSFPKAHINVSNLVITNFKPFKDETFATAKSLSFTIPIEELFKKPDEDPIIINSIGINEALLTLKTDTFGNNNYDITKDNENAPKEEVKGKGFSLDIKDYRIQNSALTYIDETSKTLIHVSELSHKGKGVFSTEKSELDTKSKAHISIAVDSTTYLSNNPIRLDALIGLDLNDKTYTFKENKGFINELPLEFQGYVKLLENGQEIDITFENPESSFKDFLAVIPKEFSKNIDDVQTTGDFKVKGLIKGLVSGNTIPNLDIGITSNNASFKYPNLPKRVEQISINANIKNTTGHAEDTYIDVNTINFKIDQDIFKASAVLKNIRNNMLVNAQLDGVLNLANINKVYPIELKNELSGILKGKINTSFDIKAIKTNAYDRIKNSGTMRINDFIFSSEDIINPIHISEADMTFNTGNVALNNFKAKTGQSDLSASGAIKNLLGFLLSDNTLQGNFNVNSNTFMVSDFMTENETTSTKNKPKSDQDYLKIPAFLDCTINANVNTVHYDNLRLKKVKGIMIVKDENVILQNMTSNLFEGELDITGLVSTKTETPTFNMNLGAKNFDISQSFSGLELFQNIAPIAKAIQGKLNSSINLQGSLDNEFSPNLNSMSGSALAELLTSTINPLNSTVLDALGASLNFIDFKKLDLKGLKTKLEFKDGLVRVKPFNITYNDINIEVSGSHSFNKTMDYSAVFNVPAKYFGSEVNRLIGKINDDSINSISIPVTANITGTYANPTVKTDLTGGVSNLTKQLIEFEKQKLLNKGNDKVKDLFEGLLGGSTKTVEKDSTKTNTTQMDSTKTNTINTVENDIKNVLGGLLGENKKKKDSIQ